MPATPASVHTQLAATMRHDYGRIVAVLTGHLGGDIQLAEDVLQAAFEQALKQWPRTGLPANPTAWLTAVAKRRAIDQFRRNATAERHQADLFALTEPSSADHEDDLDMPPISDERLKLMFTCCHPALAPEAQIALTLRVVAGLTPEEIARAFLLPISTLAQRLQRAKQKIKRAGIPYAVPPLAVLPERLHVLLTVLYLIFNEGYVATRGDSLQRQALCAEAIRLTEILLTLLPADDTRAEAEGLLALMLLHSSRQATRLNAAGELVLLADQPRHQWDAVQIQTGLARLQAALALRNPGPYQVQAAISALHAEAPTAAETDWPQIAELYSVLAEMQPTPVVLLNRAVAVAMATGPRAGLALLTPLAEALANYHPYHVAHASLLQQIGEREAALEAYEQALALCQNSAERAHLQRQIATLRP